MKLSLEDKNWGEFRLEDIFEVENCKCSKVSDLKDGKFPYVGATNRNNGVMSFVKPIQKLITRGNCIAFICDGEGSVGLSIYRKSDFIGSTTVKVGRNEYLNEYIGQFITTIADKVRHKYNFGFKRNEKHLKNEVLILPTNSQGNPDYEFMEAYMRQKEQEKLDKYKAFVLKRLAELQDYKDVEPLEDKEWGEFFMTDIFTEIQRGKRLKKSDHKKGVTPYVSSTALNNGVDGFIGNENGVRIFSECLTLANSGSVGATFYQPFKFVASDHVTKLENDDFSQFIYKFIATIVERISVKYSFNREINNQRIEREKIILPLNNQNQPDYGYMENYMKRLEYKMIKQYLDVKSN